MRMRLWTTNLALACISTCAFAQTLPSTGVRVVPTYEAAGLYWSSPGASSAGCDIQYRKVGDANWRAGLGLVYDPTATECRGSLVNLSPGTAYEAQLAVAGQPAARAITFTTWANQLPVAKVVTVPAGNGTYNIAEGGSASGYVVYDGGGAVLDGQNVAQYNVTINASYVILRNLVLKGARQDAIRISPNVSDVIVEDNDISGWGRTRDGTWGTDMDSGIRAVCTSETLTRVTVQRNKIHDPRYPANSWSDGHPAGPQGITFSYCAGNHVFRWNEIYSAQNHFNDGMGGEDNFSTSGFPNRDSDVYGNRVEMTWDDGLEIEGGNTNVRVWGNYLNNTATGIASTITSVGPLYIFRNVFNRNRFYEKTTCDADERQPFFKSGSSSSFGNGRRYLFHNTMLQATQAGCVYGLGGGAGVGGTGDTQLVENTISMNNIYHIWKPNSSVYQIGTTNTFQNDMFNGRMDTTVVGGINATPSYLAGNGWQSEAGGLYQLAPGTPGYDGGVRIANFNDGFLGAAPDVGAAESGAAAMVFGIAASSYVPSVTPVAPPPPPPPSPPPPTIGSAPSSATMDSTSYTIAAGSSVTFTAAVMGNNGEATGTVAFNDNGTPIAGCAAIALATGKALCTTSALAAGSHTITGAYSGDATYAPGTAGPITQTVTAPPPPPPAIGTASVSATMDSSSYTIGAGTTVTFTAAISGASGTPTGTVAFADNGAAIPGCEAIALSSGKAYCSTSVLAAGSHKITGNYSGDATYGKGVAGPITQTVTAAVVLPTSFGLDSSSYTIHRGDSVTFTAYIPGVGGTVNFTDNNVSIAGCGAVTVPATGIAVCATKKVNVLGVHAIRGVYSGTQGYAAGIAGPISETVIR